MEFKNAEQVQRKKAYHHQYYLDHAEKQKAQRKARYLAKRELISAQAKVYRQKHPEVSIRSYRKYQSVHRDELRKRQREWRLANPERAKASDSRRKRRYYIKNRELCLQKNKQWRQRNPEYAVLKTMKRRALKKLSAVNNNMIVEWMKSVRSKRFFNCYYCEERFPIKDIHFDHIVPLSKGGPHCVENLCTACPKCNCSKGAKPVRVWIESGQQLLEV